MHRLRYFGLTACEMFFFVFFVSRCVLLLAMGLVSLDVEDLVRELLHLLSLVVCNLYIVELLGGVSVSFFFSQGDFEGLTVGAC